MAGRRRGAPRLCSGRRQVRRRSASRDRHRRRRGRLDSRARGRRSVVRRPGSDVRTHGHDRHRRRIQSVAHASRNNPRPQGRHRRRGGPDRGPRAIGRCRAPGFVRPSRHSGRRGRVRRPTRSAPVAECPQSSPGTRGAARPGSLIHSGARASTGWRAGGADSRCSCAHSRCPRAVGHGFGDVRGASSHRTRARGRGAGRRCRGDLDGGCPDSHRRSGGCTGAGRDLATPAAPSALRRRGRDDADETHDAEGRPGSGETDRHDVEEPA